MRSSSRSMKPASDAGRRNAHRRAVSDSGHKPELRRTGSGDPKPLRWGKDRGGVVADSPKGNFGSPATFFAENRCRVAKKASICNGGSRSAQGVAAPQPTDAIRPGLPGKWPDRPAADVHNATDRTGPPTDTALAAEWPATVGHRRRRGISGWGRGRGHQSQRGLQHAGMKPPMGTGGANRRKMQLAASGYI